MSFTCNNHGRIHSHELAIEGRVCYGLAPRSAIPRFDGYRPATDSESITVRQIAYLISLGGEPHNGMSKKEASAEIDRLRRGYPAPRVAKVTEDQVPPPMHKPKFERKIDPRLEMLQSLLTIVPDGYFATQLQDGDKINFVRISRPKLGVKTFGGSIKIQTQHGPTLDLAAVYWQSKLWSVYKPAVIDTLMALVVDFQGCALRYSREIGKCARCNLSLTDPRSRHYGIGPECEQHWPWMLEMVDLQNDEKTFEELHRLGLLGA